MCGNAFVVGADTAARIVEPRFYGGTEAGTAEALGRFRSQGCRFLVAGRARPDGAFADLSSLAIPEPWRDLFDGIPGEIFRVDLSSTELRADASAKRS